MKPVLQLKGVTYIHNGASEGNVALDNIYLDVYDGEFIMVVGDNGAGKSTLFKVITEARPASGQVFFDGVDISNTPQYKRSTLISFLPQDISGIVSEEISLKEHFAVLENNGKWFSIRRSFRNNRVKRLKEIVSKIDAGLADRLNDPLTSFSGGQRQAVLLSLMALTGKKLLLMDEPTANLSREKTTAMECHIENTIRETKATVMWITHDLEIALRHGTRIIMVQSGRIVQDMSGKEKMGLSLAVLREKMKSFSATD